MAQYIDGFIIPIQKKRVKEYLKMAQIGCKVWMKHGALHYYETVVDDFVHYGMGFKKMCKLKKDETVILSYIVYKSKAHREAVNKKVMKEFSTMGSPPEMPFSMKRFVMGGATVLVKKNK